MKLFEAVKANVTTRQAAELYGIHVNRNSMAVCPFHNDKNPSMKIDRRFHCFGCQADGDAIDFTAKLFGLTPVDAAMKLAADFGVAYTYNGRDSPAQAKKQAVARNVPMSRRELEQEITRAVRVYVDYRNLLMEWKQKYAPKDMDAEWDERFCEALERLSVIEYKLDILLFGEQEVREKYVLECRKEVEEIEQRCERYRGKGKSLRTHEEYGQSL